MKKFFLTILTLILLPQVTVEAIEGENLSPAQCVAKGKLDFTSFLNTSIFADGFDQGTLEQFRDVFGRNQCQANDVSSLIGQRNKLRSQIRDAFLTCNTQKLPALTKGLAKADAEIYYVRHVVDGGVVLKIPYTSISAFEQYYYPSEKLYAEMKERYVDSGDFEAGEFDLFFDQLQSKYEDRKKSYVLCENSSWEQVSKKWEEFIESAGGTAEAWEDLEKGVVGRGQRLVEVITDGSFEEYFSGVVNFRLNNLEPQEGFGQILQETEQFLPSGQRINQESVLNAVQRSNVAFDVATMETNLRADFTILYKDTSDQTVQYFIDNLNALNQAIVDSYTPQANILNCVKTINMRQCPTSQ